MMSSNRLMSGFRVRKPAETYVLVKEFALSKGITRVTDITNLDYFGVPVYSSIRPGAAPGSLCVNAGKGLRAIDAKVGAYMEAIEFAYAEIGNSDLEIKNLKPSELDPNSPPEYILDFCPLLGTGIDLNKKIGCVEATNILNGQRTFVPAELVFFPCPKNISIHRYFGSSTNGLASGNDVIEATLHGLLELIERDVKSFHSIRDDSILLDYETLPGSIKNIVKKVDQMGYFISIRYMPNMYNLPCFTATIGNLNDHNPIYISGGYGCHLSRNIALTRAVTECFQSRLSFIHGGRDDLSVRYEQFAGWTQDKKKKYCQQLIAILMKNESEKVSFNKLPDQSRNLHSVEDSLERLCRLLIDQGFNKILRIIYTRRNDIVQVVRVIVPKMESFTSPHSRIGNRLKDYARTIFK
jgi:ribosomal protein S12 methylthiotransferase accessory factor